MRYVVLIEVCDWCGAKHSADDALGWHLVERENGEQYDYCSERCHMEAERASDEDELLGAPDEERLTAMAVIMPSARKALAASFDAAARKITAAAAPDSGAADTGTDDGVDDDDEWFEGFMDAVGDTYEIANPSPYAISGYLHTAVDDDEDHVYHVIMFPNLVEISGEACLPGNINVQLDLVFDLFDEVHDVAWTFNSPNRGAVSVTGIADGRDVWLELLDHAPDGELPTSRMLPDGAFEDINPPSSSEEIKRAAAKQPPYVVKPGDN